MAPMLLAVMCATSAYSSRLDPYRRALVAVPSARYHFTARAALRTSFARAKVHFGREITSTVRMLRFFVGSAPPSEPSLVAQRLSVESTTHGDIVMLPFVDTYRNLTRKTEGIMRWMLSVRAPVRGLTHVVKVDDDVFLDYVTLSRVLLRAPTTRFYYGARLRHTPVLRRGKNAVSRSVMSRDFYPDYNAGPLYMLSVDMAKAVGEAWQPFQSDLTLQPNEDVNTGVILEMKGVAPYHWRHHHRRRIFCYAPHREVRWARPSDRECRFFIGALGLSPEAMMGVSGDSWPKPKTIMCCKRRV